MTYCVGIKTHEGLVLASDSRSNAGHDQVNICRKMHTFAVPGERVFAVMASGSLSLTQSVITLLRQDFDAGKGLATAETFYDAVRMVGQYVRRVSDMDREALEKDEYNFNIHLLIGGQIRGEASQLYLVYPQGNPLKVTHETPFLQIGEYKYGRPILERGLVYSKTTLESAALYVLLSFDATMRSNVTVGPPIEIMIYRNDQLEFGQYCSFSADDPQMLGIHKQWEIALRDAVEALPPIEFGACLSNA
ncbi:peptidase [Acidobacterium sp. S8]|uniref:peptidase n=1 Tax=Acidobacterium sp. S8 TaxID=1641854 RepID=UPI00131B5262|nr:peptidase [Acidobacterium sp. S8]